MRYLLQLLLGLFLFISIKVQAQSFASWTDSVLTLNNGLVERTIQLPLVKNGHFVTSVYKPTEGDFNYFQPVSTDFQFEIDRTIYSGKGKWVLKNIAHFTDAKQGNGV